MAKNKITDWDIQLGWDSSKIDAGMKKFEDRLTSMSKLQMKLDRSYDAIKKAQNRDEAKALRQAEKEKARAIKAAEVAEAKRVKQEIADRLKIQKISERAAKKEQAEADRKARQMLKDRLQLHKISVQLANREAAARAKADRIAAGVNRPISFERRLQRRNTINSATLRAENMKASLGKNDSENANIARAGLERTIDRLRRAQEALAVSTSTNSKSYQRMLLLTSRAQTSLRSLSKQVRDANKEFKASQFASKGFSDSLRNLTRSYLSIFAVIGAGRAVFGAIKDFARIDAVMTLAAGSASLAGEEMKFVRSQADYLGADLIATADAYASFSVAAKSAGIDTNATREIFSDLSKAVQASGLDAEKSGYAFLAFRQMLSGPNIQMQEINQAVEHMPQFLGAAQKALKAMGHEGTNFKDIIASGKVESLDFVRTVSQMMREDAIATGALEKSRTSVIASQNRMNTAFQNMSKAIGEAGLNDIIMDVFAGITAVMKGLTPLIAVTVKGVSLLTGAIRWALEPIDRLVKALGLDSGLAGVLVAIAAILGTGMLVKQLATLVTWVRNLGIATAILQGILSRGKAVGALLAGGTLAAVGANALFDAVAPETAAANSNLASAALGGSTTTVEQNLYITSTLGAMDIKRAAQQGLTEALS